MNIYEQAVNYFTGYNVEIPEEKAKENPLANLLINRLALVDELVSFQVDFFRPGAIFKLTKETITRVDLNKPLEINESVSIHYHPTIKDAVLVNFYTLNSLRQAFIDKEIGFLVAFAILKKNKTTTDRNDFKTPKTPTINIFKEHLLSKILKKINVRKNQTPMQGLINQQLKIGEEISRLQGQLTDIQQEIKEREMSLLFSHFDRNVKDTINFLLKTKTIDQDSITYISSNKTDQPDIIRFTTTPLYIYKMNKTYMEKAKNSIFKNHKQFMQHFQDIIDDKVKIYIGEYTINIRVTSNKLIIDWTPVVPALGNPHTKINCLGGSREPFNQAVKDGDIITALTILFEHFQSINFGDAGSYNLPNCCMLIDVETNKTIYPASTLPEEYLNLF